MQFGDLHAGTLSWGVWTVDKICRNGVGSFRAEQQPQPQPGDFGDKYGTSCN